MTPEERAEQVWTMLFHPPHVPLEKRAVAAAIRAAVAEERERCAKIAEGTVPTHDSIGNSLKYTCGGQRWIAAAIRKAPTTEE